METTQQTTSSAPASLGNFSGLAENYSKYRPGYADSVLNALLGQLQKPLTAVEVADVGAGTGIWSRLIANKGVKHVYAVEPNDDMRTRGAADCLGHENISYSEGAGDATGLANESVDMVSMASSFHWVDFDAGTKEFHRILRPGGRFVALWNPRYLDKSPLLLEIEKLAHELANTEKRVSSGNSGRAAQMIDLLEQSPQFDDVCYIEGRHTVRQNLEHYLGVWRSVNDLQVRMGPEKFEFFLKRIEEMVSTLGYVDTTYLTRAWSAKKIT